jgi:hypothetical protein
MRFFRFTLIPMLLLIAVVMLGQTSTQPAGKKAQPAGPAPRHDLSGVWYPGFGGGGGGLTEKTRPPFTAWGLQQFNANRPASGPREDPTNTNDRYLDCDPLGLPRVGEYPRPLEILNVSDRMLISYEINNTWREIWTDGRELPKDPDPWWYGHSVGKWVDDYTFVVETIGFNDKSWLNRLGDPHSDQMHLTEVYKRLDHNTFQVTYTVDDSKTYTKPWVGTPRTYTLKPTWEIEETYCVIDDERGYFNAVTRPADPNNK